MHYHVGDPGNPIFESRTGIPLPADIGSNGALTITDKAFLQALYPAAPVIRRTDGVGGAREVQQAFSIAVMLTLAGNPVVENLCAAAGHDVEQLPASQVNHPGDEDRWMAGVRGQERGLVHPERCHPILADWIIDQRRAVLADRCHHGAHETPNARASCATECPSSPTWRHASTAARTVQPGRACRAGIAELFSVQVLTGQACSTHRQTRLTHTTVTGRPADGRSRT